LAIKGSPDLSVVHAISEQGTEEDRKDPMFLARVFREKTKQWIGPEGAARRGNRFSSLRATDLFYLCHQAFGED
jgi:hypothetical protein